MDNRIRIFIKIYRTGKSFDAFSCVVIGENGKIGRLSEAGLSDSRNSVHRITLEAIRHFLSSVSNSEENKGLKLVFYADNDQIAYEWNNEHMKEGAFSDATEDLDLYNSIIKLLCGKHLSMEIVGKDNVLSSMKRVV